MRFNFHATPPHKKPARPILRYHGGKWLLAPWIISHFPPHRIYTEAWGGAASVLLSKPRSYSEVYNDLDGEIVNLFTMVRERGAELVESLSYTPYARAEYRLSFVECADRLEQARRTFIRSYMGFGSNSLCRTVRSGFRSNSNRSGTTPSRDWKNFPAALGLIVERLQGVVLENKPALEIVQRHDARDALHYCDPTYLHTTRTQWAGHGARSGYKHEMTEADHREMAKVLRGLKGMVVVSGYASALYDKELFKGWNRAERKSLADGARPRLECLWLNRQASENLKSQNPKFKL